MVCVLVVQMVEVVQLVGGGVEVTGQTVVEMGMVSVTTVVWPPGQLVTSGGHLVMVCVLVVQMVDVVQLVVSGLEVVVGGSSVDVVLAGGVVVVSGLLVEGVVSGLLVEGVVSGLLVEGVVSGWLVVVGVVSGWLVVVGVV